jgi:hypothetical protein
MDFEQNNNFSEPTEPQPVEPVQPVTKTPKKRTGWRIFWGVILVLSVLANLVLFMMLICVVAVFAAGQKGIFAEEVMRTKGSKD